MPRATQSVILEWLSKGESAVASKATVLNKKITKVNKTWGAISKKALMAGTVMTVVTGLMVRQASKFEKAMADASAVTSDLADIDFVKMKKMAKSTAIELGISADKIASGFYYLGSAGFTATEQLEAFPKVAKLVVAGNIEMAQASEMVADTLRGFRLESKDTGRVVDVMAKAVMSSNQTFDQLGQTLSMVAGVAESAGLSLEQTVAVTEMLANVGIKGTRSGTALRTALINLQAPTSQTADALKKLNVEVYDSSGNARDFIDVIGDLSKGLNEGTQEERMFALNAVFGKRAMAGFASITKEGETNLRKLTDELINAGGAVDEVVQKKMKAFERQLARLKTAIGILSGEIAETLLPQLTKMATSGTNLVQSFRKMSEGTKKLIAGFGLWGGAGLILVGVLGKVAIFINKIITVMPLLIAKIGMAKLAIGGWVIVLATLAITLTKTVKKVLELKKATVELAEAEALRKQMEAGALAMMNKWSVAKLKALENEKKAYNMAKVFSKELTRYMAINAKEITSKTREQLNARREAYTTFYKSLEESVKRQTEVEKKEVGRRTEVKDQESEQDRLREQTDEEARLQHLQRIQEMELALDEEIYLAGLVNLEKQKALIDAEKEAKIKAYEDELLANSKTNKLTAQQEKQLAEYSGRLTTFTIQQKEQMERQYRNTRIQESLDMTQQLMAQTIALFSVSKKTTSNELRLMKSLIVAQQSLAIARLWASEAKKGILGIATATLGTIAIVANMKKQTDALDDAWATAKEGIEEPIIPHLEEPEDISGFMEKLDKAPADAGMDRLNAQGAPRAPRVAGVGGGRVVNINVGDIRNTFNIERLEHLDKDTLAKQLNQIGEAIRRRTIEALELVGNVNIEINRINRKGLA